MDAPPEQEDSKPFLEVATFLAAMHLNAPRVLQADLEQGFLLLTDLGSLQYLEALDTDPAAADELYTAAIRALVTMQMRGRRYQGRLPRYDEKLLRFELSLFHDWLCERHLGLEFGAAAESEWQSLCDRLVDNALDQPRVFVHRDYHSRNLMVCGDESPGILDFQDAVEGPLAYDLVSLLKDCYVKWPRERVDGWRDAFQAGLEAETGDRVDRAEFHRAFDLTGVQRHLKAAGIFARLKLRDGKPGYVEDIPRTLGYVSRAAGAEKRLGFLAELIDERVLPAL